MKTGILGGTFNPIHLAHLRIAEEVREICGLDRILFMPAAEPPHKSIAQGVPFADRMAMVEQAIADNPAFHASDLETRRPGKSYSVHTLETLIQEWPEDDFFFIIGLDSFRDIGSWKEYQRLFFLTNLVVAARPGITDREPQSLLPVAVREEFCYDCAAKTLIHTSGKKIVFAEETFLDISSTRIRRLTAEGRSIRYLVPPNAEDYIRRQGLYRRRERS